MNLDKLSNMVRKTFKPTEVEAKLQEALSKKNWGASSTVMNDIARYTFDYQEYGVVMKAVWNGVNEKGKNWRVVFKALSLLEHLIKNGAERCVDEARERIYTIRTLTEFRYNEDGTEKGTGVREKAKLLVELLNDTKQIREARKKARELRDKFVGISSHSAQFNRGGGGGGSGRRNGGGSGRTFDRRDDFGGFGNES